MAAINSISIQQAIQNAAEALRSGDKCAARHWAQIGVSIAPQIEEPWLILAAVSGPHAAVEYLKQALLVHPGSPRAMRGLRWAQDQLARQAPQQPRQVVSSMSDTQPISVRRPAAKPASRKKMPAAKRLTMPVLLLTLMCVLAAWAAWPGSASSALALIRSGPDSETSGPAWSQAQIAKPSYTPTVTLTWTPTLTPLPTSTATLTSAPTDTPTPTALPTDSIPAETLASPTDVPPIIAPIAGNYTVQRGDTLSSIALRAGVTAAEIAAANQMSVYATIYAGQVLGIPQGGTIPDPVIAPEPGSDSPVPSGGEKYILVDISEQHLYAYEGNALVYSFVASTGMKNATRVGVFQVQDKIPNAYGANWNIWMPNWMGIYYSGSLENGIHALPILPGGARLWAGYLGTPISYGCVVLGVQEAQQLYDWAEVGTTVEIRW
jgi:LysM repeat protein